MARVNRTRFAVLGMLSIGERSGYDLKKEFENRMSHFWAESAGQIYPTLKKLLDQGLVRVTEDSTAGRRERTVYRITASGRRELRGWLQKSPQREQVRNEILLKLYFGPEMGAKTALEHLARFESGQRSLLELMEGFEQEIGEVAESNEQEIFWRITLSAGVHVVRARVAWSKEARRRLSQLQRPRGPREEE